MGCRHSSDPTLLWLWCRLAATALIGPLAWVLPYAVGMALKRPKKKKVEYHYLYYCRTNQLGLETTSQILFSASQTQNP